MPCPEPKGEHEVEGLLGVVVRYLAVCGPDCWGNHDFPSVEATRVRYAAQRRGCRMATLGARAAADDARGRVSQDLDDREIRAFGGCIQKRPR
jgi:hypothetical protein